MLHSDQPVPCTIRNNWLSGEFATNYISQFVFPHMQYNGCRNMSSQMKSAFF